MNSDQLGAKGEARFREICADVGMTCNPSCERDRGGWDFIIETDDDPLQTGISFDRRQGAISAHIQVKTVWKKDKNRIKMSLSSAEFLAKEPKPCFIYIFTINPDLTYGPSYVIHIWEEALEKILKGLRLAAKNKQKPNKREITFDASKHGKLLAPTGAPLKAELVNVVAHDFNKYISDKQLIRQSVGFDDYPIQTSFAIEAQSLDELEECLVGERTISVSDFQVFETRFGIKLPLAGNRGKSTLSVTPHPILRSTLRAKAEGQQVCIEVSIVATPFRLPSDGGLVKLIHELFEFKIRGCDVSFCTNPSSFQEMRKTIEFWKRYFEFMVALTNPNSTLELRAPNGIYQELSSNISLGISEASQFRSALTGILAIEDVLSYCGEEKLELSLSEITDVMRQAKNLSSTLIKPIAPARASFTVEKNDVLKPSENIKALFVDVFLLSEKMVAYAFTADMSGEEDADSFHYVSDKCALLSISILDKSKANYDAFSERMKNSAKCAAVVARKIEDDD